MNAAYIALGHSATSSSSKATFFRRIEKDFFGAFRFVRQTLPDLTEDEFRGMLGAINPSHENYHIKARNTAAHQVTLKEARESAANAKQPHLLKWVDLMSAWEKDEQTSISDIAFDHACLDSSQIIQKSKLDSINSALLSAPHEVQLDFANRVADLLELRAAQRKLDQDNDDDALMKEGNVKFVDSE